MITHERENPELNWHDLEPGDIVLVKPPEGEVREWPLIMHQQTMAEIMVGDQVGHPEPTDALYMVRVTDPTDQDYQRLAERARARGVEPTQHMLVSMYAEPGQPDTIQAVAFLGRPDGTLAEADHIGRHGTVQWFWYGFNTSERDAANRTPFEHDTTVSRQQFAVNATAEGVGLHGLTENSRTRVTAPNMKVVYIAAESAATPAEQAARRASRNHSTAHKRQAGYDLSRRIMRRGHR